MTGGKRSPYQVRCKVCASLLGPEIDRMLSEKKSFQSIIIWASEQGLKLSKAGLSRHHAVHNSERLPTSSYRLPLRDDVDAVFDKVEILSTDNLNEEELLLYIAAFRYHLYKRRILKLESLRGATST